MTSYEFTLKLNRAITADEADALYATFGDGTIETGPDITRIDFDREAPSLAAAIVSAAFDVEKIDGLRAVGIACDDMVTLAGIAERVGVTREAARLWVTGKRGAGSFPEPMFITPAGERVWDWSVVAHWLGRNRDQLRVQLDERTRLLKTADRVLAARAALAAEPDDNARRDLGELLAV
jgi:hypothetical protein